MKREFKDTGVNKRTTHIDNGQQSAPAGKTPVIREFNWNEHAKRFRRQTQNCDNDIQHVLFVLDSSGSIGSTSYDRMKSAIAKLTPLFCRQVHFALLTFSTKFHLEFCFNCFDNTFDGRLQASDAIKAADYQAGLTYTGGAARCICEELLD